VVVGDAARVVRVSGPLVQIDSAAPLAMHELVVLGERRITAEVVAIRGRRVTVQAYEYTGGLAPGASAVALGAPLSAPLGPGLLGGVFDGLLRPLHSAPTWLAPGHDNDTDARTWLFEPKAQVGATSRPVRCSERCRTPGRWSTASSFHPAPAASSNGSRPPVTTPPTR